VAGMGSLCHGAKSSVGCVGADAFVRPASEASVAAACGVAASASPNNLPRAPSPQCSSVPSVVKSFCRDDLRNPPVISLNPSGGFL
jgi:hypothetical protein